MVVGNQGDGKAPGSKLHLFLVPKRGKPKPLETGRVPRLPSGRSKKVQLESCGCPRA